MKSIRAPAGLSRLLVDIDVRVQSIRGERADWLCAKGCDSCCRRLADVPQLTAAEWDLLRPALAALAAPALEKIRHRMLVLGGGGDGVGPLAHSAPRVVVCPLLDLENGACPVYAARPVACRTYGFYVQRELGLYCSDIESRVADGALAGVVWGNHDGVDRRLADLGETRALTEWFARWEAGH